MVKCAVRRKFPALGPKGCTVSSKSHKKSTSKSHSKPASTPVSSTPDSQSKSSSAAGPSTPTAQAAKRRITPQATGSSSSLAKSPILAFTDSRTLTKGQESYKQAVLALEKKAAGYDKKYKRVLKR